jgi:hypothetical protein
MGKKKKSRFYYFALDYAYREKMSLEDAWNSVECRDLYQKIFKPTLFTEINNTTSF